MRSLLTLLTLRLWLSRAAQAIYLKHDQAVEALESSTAAVDAVLHKTKNSSRHLTELKGAVGALEAVSTRAVHTTSTAPGAAPPRCTAQNRRAPKKKRRSRDPYLRRCAACAKAVIMATEANIEMATIKKAQILLTNARANLRVAIK